MTCGNRGAILARDVAMVLAVLLSGSWVPGAMAGDELLFALPPGWHEIYQGREENLSTTEYVPETQGEKDWEEMLSVQIVVGLGDADPDRVLSNIVNHLDGQCLDFDVKPIELGGTGAYPTLAVILNCGELRSNSKGEFSLLRGIAGGENFYLLRKTWRTDLYRTGEAAPVPLDERKFWMNYLAFLRICNTEAGDCPAKPTTNATP